MKTFRIEMEARVRAAATDVKEATDVMEDREASMLDVVRRVTVAALAVGVPLLVFMATSAPATAGAVEVAKARSTSGVSVLMRNGVTENVGGTTQFQEGDSLRVPTDGRMTVEFADGASVTLIGPATLRFGQMNAEGRRVVLGSGAISEAVVRGIALEIQAPSPTDASFVLQNSRGFARVAVGDRVVFQKLEGGYAKVWRGGQQTDLAETAWVLDVRGNSVTYGDPGRVVPTSAARGGRADQVGSDAVRLVLGARDIVFHPAKLFKRTDTTSGGVILCFNGPDDEFGVVEVGRDTMLFLAGGQCVEFDQYGNVLSFDGISHIYHPLSDAIFYDETVENAADASPAFSKPR